MKTRNFYKLFAGLALGSIVSGPIQAKTESKNLEFKTIEYSDPIKKNIKSNSKKTYIPKFIDYDPIKSQRGLDLPRIKDTLDNFYVYEFDFNYDLKKAINLAKKPKLYTNDPRTHIGFNSDTTSAILYYPKKNFDETGNGKTIAISIRDEENIKVSDPKGLGNINNHLPSIYWAPNHLFEKKEKKTEEQKTSKEPINNVYVENKIFINNFNENNSKNKKNTLRGGIEVLAKYPSKEIHVGSFVQALIGKKWFLGFYGRTNLTKKEETTSKNYIYNEKLSNNLNLESTGFDDFNLKEKSSFEGGVIASYVLNKIGFDFSLGANKKINQINSINKGYDRIVDNDGKIISEKPFCVEKEFVEKNTNFVGGISLNYYPTKNLSIGVEGKIDDKSNFSGGIKASIIFGGKRK